MAWVCCEVSQTTDGKPPLEICDAARRTYMAKLDFILLDLVVMYHLSWPVSRENWFVRGMAVWFK